MEKETPGLEVSQSLEGSLAWSGKALWLIYTIVTTGIGGLSYREPATGTFQASPSGLHHPHWGVVTGAPRPANCLPAGAP